METAHTRRTERDGLCRIRIRAGLARQKAVRCCTARDCRETPRPMDPPVISIRWLPQGMDARIGSPASRQSLRIANLETRMGRGILAIQEGPAFPQQGRG